MHRYLLFAFPASIVEVDPNWYAAMADSVLSAGSTAVIDVGFYEQAPLSIILPAIVSAITGLPGEHALIVYPLFMGVVIPTAVCVILRSWSEAGPRVVLAVALLASTMSLSMKFSYMPMANGLAAAYWLIFLLSIPHYERLSVASLPAVLLVFALTFTHKLGLIIPVMGLFAILAVRWASPVIVGWRRRVA